MPVPEQSIPFALPDITEAEISAVTEVMRSRWLTTGSQAREFETRFAEAVGSPYAVALNSCTAALHLSLEALGVTEGDLVFLPPYTFAASAEVIRYVGATPVFVDVEPGTMNLDPKALRQAVCDGAGHPAVVMPVHFSGLPVDQEAVWDVAREFDLAVVEDAAHAFPSVRAGRTVGTLPDDIRGAVCFSFYATKTITTGEGGMLTTSDQELAERVRLMSLHGLSKQAWNRYAGGSWRYDIVAPGFKYNLTDIAAAMGLVQLERAEEMRAKRERIAGAYTAAFESLPAFSCPEVPEDAQSSWHLYVLRLRPPASEKHRDWLIDELRARGIGASMHFIPLHLHTYYRDTFGLRPEDFPISLDGYQRALSLPIYSSMSAEEVERVLATVVELEGELCV